MAYHYCTCFTDMTKAADRHAVNQGRRAVFREVNVDSDGVCGTCGHYAVATRKWMNPEDGELKMFLMPQVLKEGGDNVRKRELARATWHRNNKRGA